MYIKCVENFKIFFATMCPNFNVLFRKVVTCQDSLLRLILFSQFKLKIEFLEKYLKLTFPKRTYFAKLILYYFDLICYAC
jgi:hypothetical protein